MNSECVLLKKKLFRYKMSRHAEFISASPGMVNLKFGDFVLVGNEFPKVIDIG